MTEDSIPVFVCGGPGRPKSPLVEAVHFIRRGQFRFIDEPSATEPCIAVVPLNDLSLLSDDHCRNAGIPFFGDWIDTALLRRLQQGEARLLFDFSGEGPLFLPFCFGQLGRWLNRQGISPSNVAFVSQNRALAADHCAAFGPSAMTFLSADYFIVHCYLDCLRHRTDATPLPASAMRPFLCLNYTPRPARVALLLSFLHSGILDRGLVSFPGLATEDYQFDDAAMGELDGLLRSLPGAVDRLPELRERGPLTVDDISQVNGALAFDLNGETYSRAYTVIVSETEASDGRIRRVTEKSIKPMAFAKPFMVFGNPLSLALLRELGFQTFHPLFDESYDEIAEPSLRLLVIHRTVERIATMDGRALLRLARQTREACDFNRRFLLSGGAIARYWSLYMAPILQWSRGGLAS